MSTPAHPTKTLSRRDVLKTAERFVVATSMALAFPQSALGQRRAQWDDRVNALLNSDEAGDIIITALGDMIWNRELTHFKEQDYRNLYRILQEAEITYGNLEMSLNERPDLQRGLYNYRKGREFGWEIAKLGVNLVSLGNNHALDYGVEGLKETLNILGKSGIAQAGGGFDLHEARDHAELQFDRTRISLLSYYSSEGARSDDGGPTIATINAPSVMIEGQNGTSEAEVAPRENDVTAMEDAIRRAKAHTDIVMVHYHLHWVSHSRAYPIPDQVPPNQRPMIHRAIDAGADVIFGNGPHVLRGIEIYKGRPIFYSLGNFIYQYKTAEIPPVIWTRDQQQDIQEEFQTIVPRLAVRDKKIVKIQLIPCTLEMTGARTGCPKLADDGRGKEIINLVSRLSEPYETSIQYNDWYGEIVL